jgi:hypothetical protein
MRRQSISAGGTQFHRMWVPSLTLAGLAIGRLGHQWPLALAQLLGITAAVTLAASIPLMQTAAAEASATGS